MTIQQLRELRYAQPFRPFIIHLADGRRVPVQNPEFIGWSPSGRRIVVYQADDSMNIIDRSSVANLEIVAMGRSSRRGKRRSS